MNQFLIWVLCILCSSPVLADKRLRIYHDADWSNHIESAESIWRGVHVALSEVDYQIQGYRIEVVKKNHSGNILRSLHNMKDFLKDDQALVVMSGIHSAPLIKNREFINTNKILTLVPWAAGGPITRYPLPENWVFRLSVDDTKAGRVLVNYALDIKGCRRPHLFLEQTPWGDSNLKNMSVALADRQRESDLITRFSWGLKRHVATNILLQAVNNGSDCILLVANSLEGVQIARGMMALDSEKRIPIISHWGITGGDFHRQLGASQRQQIDLSFIQSCFSFMSQPLSAKGRDVFVKARQQFSKKIHGVGDIEAPVGFIHGYDITRLFIGAIGQIKLVNDMSINRSRVREALEDIKHPIVGLVKTYRKPYRAFSPGDQDAHEALGEKDYCMAYYNDDDDIVVIKRRS